MNAERPNPSIHRSKVVLLLSSLVTLVLLVMAAYQENFTGEWRKHQAAYRSHLLKTAPGETARAYKVGFQQIFLPDLDRVDRCVSCHTGIDNPAMAEAEQPLRTHPGTIFEHHPLDKFGCTVCHDGQGRAVDRDTAHGDVAHWLHPLLKGKTVYRNCGRCHYENDLFGAENDLYAKSGEPNPLNQAELTAFVPGGKSIARGKQLVQQMGCLGCHTYRGRGGVLGPEITYTGDKGVHDFDFTHIQGEHTVRQWLVEHFKRPSEISPGSLMPELELNEGQIQDLTEYMLSLRKKSMSAAYTPVPPRDVSEVAGGQQLYSMFCSACHGRDGAGSTVRDPLLAADVDAPTELMVPSLNHPDTLAVASDDYLASILSKGRPETSMIAWGNPNEGGLLTEEIDQIVNYMRSWQPPRPDEMAVSASRGVASIGRSLYRQSCAACHDSTGKGGIGPSLNSPSFLAVASDEFLAKTIVDGRPNTAMPGWREYSSQQISDLVAFMRSWSDHQSNRQTVLALLDSPGEKGISATIGRTLYRANCVTCHGASGEGDLGPSLSTQEFLTLVDNNSLYETISKGRPSTGMPAWRQFSNEDIASMILYIRTWQQEESRSLSSLPVTGDWDTGEILYSGQCSSCHGVFAEGGVGPQLNNPVFLSHTSDAILKEWISHGKTGTPMRGFLKGGQGTVELKERQIDDLVSFLRSLERRPRVSMMRSPNGRPELGQIWYAHFCTSCHGDRGEGASGPSLSNPAFLGAASDGFLLATLAMGRDGTEMRPVKKSPQSILSLSSDQVNDVVAFLRSWETSPPSTDIPHRFVIPWDLHQGKQLFESNCAGCHGSNGKADLYEPGVSAWAPALNNEGFLSAATDGFLQATIVKGRGGTAMRSFGHGSQGLVDLTAEEIDNLVAYIRRWSTQAQSPMTIPAELSVEVPRSMKSE